jgi:hypothetical protein
VLAAMAVQIDLFGGNRRGLQRALQHRWTRPGNRNDRPVVIGIARPVQNQNSWNRRKSGFQSINNRSVASFREVRDTLDEPRAQAAPTFQRFLLKTTAPSRIAIST